MKRPNRGLKKYIRVMTGESNVIPVVDRYNAYSRRVGQKELGYSKLLEKLKEFGMV
jgi:hypothetical protein